MRSVPVEQKVFAMCADDSLAVARLDLARRPIVEKRRIREAGPTEKSDFHAPDDAANALTSNVGDAFTALAQKIQSIAPLAKRRRIMTVLPF
jgi:hypothetical protein